MFFHTRPSPEKPSFHELLNLAFSSGELLTFSIRKIEELILKDEKSPKELSAITTNIASFRRDAGISRECSEKIKNILMNASLLSRIVTDFASKSGLLATTWYSWQAEKQIESIAERLLAHLWGKIIRNRVVSTGSRLEQKVSDADSVIETILLGTHEKIHSILLVHGWRRGELIDRDYLPVGKFMNIFPDIFEHSGMPYKKVRLENGKFTFMNLIDGTLWDEYDFIGQPQLSYHRNNNHISTLLPAGLTGKQSITFTAFRDGKQVELPFLYEFPHIVQRSHHSH